MPARRSARPPVEDLPVVPAAAARRLLLGGLGLTGDPGRKATPARVRRAPSQRQLEAKKIHLPKKVMLEVREFRWGG